MLKSPTKKHPENKAKIQKILSSVPYERGFHFFTDTGKYTGETAINLFSFYEELKTIEPESVKFHFQRRDPQNWVGSTLGDSELANRIDRIDASLSGENLKRELFNVVQTRLKELQALWRSP